MKMKLMKMKINKFNENEFNENEFNEKINNFYKISNQVALFFCIVIFLNKLIDKLSKLIFDFK